MTTASDNFNRANETPIASPWVAAIGAGANLTLNVLTSIAATEKISYYSAAWGNDHDVSGIVGTLVANVNYSEVTVRFDSAGSGFSVYTDGTAGTGHTEFASYTAGAPTVLGAIASAFANGDTIKLTVTGQSPNIVLTAFKNGTQIAQITGQTGKNSGNPGGGGYGIATIDDWSATDNAAAAVNALDESGYYPTEPQTNPLAVSIWS